MADRGDPHGLEEAHAEDFATDKDVAKLTRKWKVNDLVAYRSITAQTGRTKCARCRCTVLVFDKQ
jgi:hypothetical protein